MAKSFRSRHRVPPIDPAWVAAQPVQGEFWSPDNLPLAPPPYVSMPLGEYRVDPGHADIDGHTIRPEHIVCKQPQHAGGAASAD